MALILPDRALQSCTVGNNAELWYHRNEHYTNTIVVI